MLNALRHLIGNQPNCSPCTRPSRRCAQRLTASDRQSNHRRRHHGRRPDVLNALRHLIGNQERCKSLSIPRRCAQRLTASDRQSKPRRRNRLAQQRIVLNALRHLIGNQIHRSLSAPAWAASSAQRLTASDRQSRILSPYATMFIEVLNALRHLIGNQPPPHQQQVQRPLCSTPYGI